MDKIFTEVKTRIRKYKRNVHRTKKKRNGQLPGYTQLTNIQQVEIMKKKISKRMKMKLK